MAHHPVSTHIPQLFVRYVRFPLKLALLMPVILVLGLMKLHHFRPEARHSPDQNSQSLQSIEPSASNGIEVTISGQYSLRLRANSVDAEITSGSLSGANVYRVLTDNNQAIFNLRNSAGTTLAVLQSDKNEDGWKHEIRSAQGSVLYLIKNTDEGYKVLSSSQELLNKVKIKEDKFNIYSPENVRIIYGKFKNGGVSIRLDSGSEVATLWNSKTLSLRQISPLMLPISEEARLLLFMAITFVENQ